MAIPRQPLIFLSLFYNVLKKKIFGDEDLFFLLFCSHEIIFGDEFFSSHETILYMFICFLDKILCCLNIFLFSSDLSYLGSTNFFSCQNNKNIGWPTINHKFCYLNHKKTKYFFVCTKSGTSTFLAPESAPYISSI